MYTQCNILCSKHYSSYIVLGGGYGMYVHACVCVCVCVCVYPCMYVRMCVGKMFLNWCGYVCTHVSSHGSSLSSRYIIAFDENRIRFLAHFLTYAKGIITARVMYTATG